MAVLCLALPAILGQYFDPIDSFGPSRFDGSRRFGNSGGFRRFGNSGESRGFRDSDRSSESGVYRRYRYNRSGSGERRNRRSRARDFRDARDRSFGRPFDRNPFDIPG